MTPGERYVPGWLLVLLTLGAVFNAFCAVRGWYVPVL